MITETKKKLKMTKDIDDIVMIYNRVPQNKRVVCRVAILLDKKWKKIIVNYTFVNIRIITVRLKIVKGHLSVFGVYVSENSKKELQHRLTNCNKNGYMIPTGYLNARIGNQLIPNVVGTFEESCLNESGNQVRDFASFDNLKITNIFFQKKKRKKFT